MTFTSTSTNFDGNNPLKVGIVGTGFAASKRAEALQEDDRATLIAVNGHHSESTQEFCDRYGSQGISSWEELVQQPELDLVMICTVNRDHGAIAQAALEAGKHVVIEYPLALNPSQAEELINLAKKHNKLLHVEHIELLGGLHNSMRESLSEIGNVFYARYVTIVPQHPAPAKWTYHHDLFGFPFSAALSRIHRFTDLFGKVASVSCQTRFWDTSNGYYSACLCNAQLRFHSGLIADVTYGKGETFWSGDRTFELHGDRGTAIFAGEQGTLMRGENHTPIEVAPRRGLFTQDTTLVLDHLTEGKPLYVSPEASLYALRVADATRQSAESGKVVDL